MSRAEKREQALRQQKNAKQKKILIGLAPLFLLLLVWQGPGTLKAMTGGEKTPPPIVQPEGGETAAPAGDPVTGPAPSTSTPGGTTTTPVPAVTTLPETNDPADPDAGQLIAFDRFYGKDPFDQLVEDTVDTGGTGAPAPDPTPTTGGDGDGDGNGGDGDGDGDDPSGPSSATLTVNGNPETLGARDTFPSNDPVFRLKSISANAVSIVLVTGDFTEGQEAVTVRVGRSVTLVSQPDGLRYVIKLVSVGP